MVGYILFEVCCRRRCNLETRRSILVFMFALARTFLKMTKSKFLAVSSMCRLEYKENSQSRRICSLSSFFFFPRRGAARRGDNVKLFISNVETSSINMNHGRKAFDNTFSSTCMVFKRTSLPNGETANGRHVPVIVEAEMKISPAWPTRGWWRQFVSDVVSRCQ